MQAATLSEDLDSMHEPSSAIAADRPHHNFTLSAGILLVHSTAPLYLLFPFTTVMILNLKCTNAEHMYRCEERAEEALASHPPSCNHPKYTQF